MKDPLLEISIVNEDKKDPDLSAIQNEISTNASTSKVR